MLAQEPMAHLLPHPAEPNENRGGLYRGAGREDGNGGDGGSRRRRRREEGGRPGRGRWSWTGRDRRSKRERKKGEQRQRWWRSTGWSWQRRPVVMDKKRPAMDGYDGEGGRGREERWQQQRERKMGPATKDGGNGYGILPEQKKEKMGEKRTVVKFGNGDPLGSVEMAIATEVSATEARRGGIGEGDGDGSFSWGRWRMSTVGAVVGKEEKREREAAMVVVAAQHAGRQLQCWQRQFAATEACWQRTMGEGKKGERRKKGRGRGEKPGGGRRGGCAPHAVACRVRSRAHVALPGHIFYFIF